MLLQCHKCYGIFVLAPRIRIPRNASSLLHRDMPITSGASAEEVALALEGLQSTNDAAQKLINDYFDPPGRYAGLNAAILWVQLHATVTLRIIVFAAIWSPVPQQISWQSQQTSCQRLPISQHGTGRSLCTHCGHSCAGRCQAYYACTLLLHDACTLLHDGMLPSELRAVAGPDASGFG